MKAALTKKPTDALAHPSPDVMEIWRDKDALRKQFGANLTPTEFDFFLSLGMFLGANPFTREIWAIKYGRDNPAQIFLGRDFYLRVGMESDQYDGHYTMPVYENDQIAIVNGVPNHTQKFTNRGKLIGAYCVVYRKGIDHPVYVPVELSEYHLGQGLWNKKPATMIMKVAEAQAFRKAFAGRYRGAYAEDEQWAENKKANKANSGASGRVAVDDIFDENDIPQAVVVDDAPAPEPQQIDAPRQEVQVPMCDPERFETIKAKAHVLGDEAQKWLDDHPDGITVKEAYRIEKRIEAAIGGQSNA